MQKPTVKIEVNAQPIMRPIPSPLDHGFFIAIESSAATERDQNEDERPDCDGGGARFRRRRSRGPRNRE